MTDTEVVAPEAGVDAWLDRVYSDVTLVVQRLSRPSAQAADGPGAALPTSSSTMPSLMVEMLEALDLGHSPTLVAGDGLAGVPDHGRYDRIIATCAVSEIPLTWIEQLAPAGAMLINLRGDVAGVLFLLSKQNDDDEVIGPVVRCGGNFMWLRRQLSSPLRHEESSIMVGARKVANLNFPGFA